MRKMTSLMEVRKTSSTSDIPQDCAPPILQHTSSSSPMLIAPITTTPYPYPPHSHSICLDYMHANVFRMIFLAYIPNIRK